MRSDSIRPCSALPDTTVMNPALSQTLLIRAAERGGDLSTITAALMRLLAQTSAAEMQAAILEALPGRAASERRASGPGAAARAAR
jgi:hypothetical protein